ncbi:S-adenosyl-L-methionine-dependent methyltransferase [Schizopora paradoxa]|uniref:S-adenosyl-L-methionine-dependent methyltransferase n=1 Tax=Schizopora paradoxa TaxID=27342 RepID=A0A0H2RQB1_9AGAM|nr:S-adenosyl-L-methionine-dependent methyltransferase [Schizopora paradoxa]
MKFASGSKVLDLGTGDGSWIDSLARNAVDVQFVGVDASSYLFPRTHPRNVRFIAAPPTKLPSSWNNQFDVVNQHLLTHAPHLSVPTLMPSEWPIVLAEILRVLKSGGSAYFSDNATGPAIESGSDSEDSDSEGSSRYRKSMGWNITQSRLRTLLEDAGFINIRPIALPTEDAKAGRVSTVAYKA